MIRDEALALLRVISSLWSCAEKLKNDILREQYVKLLESLSYSKTEQTIDQLFKSCKFMPTPPEILEVYNSICMYDRQPPPPPKQEPVKNDVFCPICLDQGYITYVKPYRRYWCDLCKVGMCDSFKEGSLPISEYLDIDKLYEQNKGKKKLTGREQFLQECKKFGFSARSLGIGVS